MGCLRSSERADSEFNYRTDEQLRLMKEAGIKSVRMDIGFGLISRKPDQYDFSHMDKVWEKLDRNGYFPDADPQCVLVGAEAESP